MRVAVPLFDERVAPRFGFAGELLIGEIEEGELISSHRVCLDSSSWNERLGRLRDMGVDALLCGGFEGRFEPLAASLGILVWAGFVGDPVEVLSHFASHLDTYLAQGSMHTGRPCWCEGSRCCDRVTKSKRSKQSKT